MRTSRLSRDTAMVIRTRTESDRPRHQTRSLARFTFPSSKPTDTNRDDALDESSTLSSGSPDSEDIEDVLTEPTRKRRRRQGHESPSTTVSAISTTSTATTRRSPLKPNNVKVEESDSYPNRSQTSSRRVPARKITRSDDGTVTIHPPSKWQETYDTICKFRKQNPIAPVDTMGCEELYHESSSPRDRRFQTLIALMLSSQTKDTVTAVAMRRLHTELPTTTSSTSTVKPSTLTLENVLAVPADHLNELIGAVGFHNNKTKYIKAAAVILRDEFDSDIPKTVEGLMRLPGVGPKMAYLCMSAAWNIDVGIGVDVHVHRITNLWGWHKTKNPEETRMWLEGWLPKDKWHEINKMLVGLGQTICLPVGRKCGDCPLGGTGLCPGEERVGKVKRRKIKGEITVKGDGSVDGARGSVIETEDTTKVDFDTLGLL